MVDIPLAHGDWRRGVAKEARIQLHNRYFEQNPVLSEQQVALIARMGMRRYLYIGDGPIRGTYSQAGSFDDALFAASGDQMWRIGRDSTKTLIADNLPLVKNFVSMAATSNIGATPEFLFFAEGGTLYCYIEDGYATGTISGTPANNDVVRLGSMYYQFTNASVDAGTPAGTLANPWLVALGANAAEAWINLFDAINDGGVGGLAYSSLLTANTEALANSLSATSVTARAIALGLFGNAVVTTETGAAIAWTAGTLTGGGDPVVIQVQTPDGVGIISVGYIASHVVVVPAQGQGVNGRFYWIEPGETTIDPLNFATAERSPDPIYGVVVFGDQFWLPGQATTEVWYFTGDPDAPVLRLQGVTFDRGTWEGTALQVKDSMIIVDSDGGVFQIGGGLKRISNPSIEERIQAAMATQSAQAALIP